jgi:molecular chaperone DnaK
MGEIAVGIDLGTSNSCVAVMREGSARVLANAQGESTTASVVVIREDHGILVGNAAKANIIHDPKHTVCSAKRLIGRVYVSPEVRKAKAISGYEIVQAESGGIRIRVRDETFSIPEISAMILRELKSVAEMRLGQPHERIMNSCRESAKLNFSSFRIAFGKGVLAKFSETIE